MRSIFSYILLFLARASDVSFFAPVHQAVRLIYRGPLRVFVRSVLITATKRRDIEVFVRHSTKSGNGFNCFLSDLDLTLVLSDSFVLQDIAKLRNVYFTIKRFLPMLGEIEVFSWAEWQLLRQLLDRDPKLFEILFDLKKIRWMEKKLEVFQDPYHRFKVKRSIWRMLKKYENDIPPLRKLPDSGNHRFFGAGLTGSLREVIDLNDQVPASPESFAVYTRELDITVGNLTRNAALSLNRELALCLLALFPIHFDDDQEIAPVLKELRKIPSIRRLHLNLLCYEILYANAAPRVHDSARDSFWIWTDDLSLQIRSCAAPADYHSTLRILNRHSAGEVQV